MSVTSGFFNSINYDRTYDARDMARIFDGIINDGVYETIGNNFMVTASGGMTVTVDTGRGWYLHTWILNDALLSLTIPQADILLNRIDAVVIEVDLDARIDRIRVVTGLTSEIPSRPQLTDAQYPLAYVYVKNNTEELTQEDITYVVGTGENPFVTGPLTVVSIDNMLAQWNSQYQNWIIAKQEAINKKEVEFGELIERSRVEFESWVTGFEQGASKEFYDWFDNIKTILDENVAAHLQNEIEEISEVEFNHYYDAMNKTIDISEDGTQYIQTSSEGSATTIVDEERHTIVTTVVPNDGIWNYRKTITKTYTDDKLTKYEQIFIRIAK